MKTTARVVVACCLLLSFSTVCIVGLQWKSLLTCFYYIKLRSHPALVTRLLRRDIQGWRGDALARYLETGEVRKILFSTLLKEIGTLRSKLLNIDSVTLGFFTMRREIPSLEYCISIPSFQQGSIPCDHDGAICVLFDRLNNLQNETRAFLEDIHVDCNVFTSQHPMVPRSVQNWNAQCILMIQKYPDSPKLEKKIGKPVISEDIDPMSEINKAIKKRLDLRSRREF